MFEKNMLIATITILSLMSGAAYASNSYGGTYGGSYGNYGGYGNYSNYGGNGSNNYYSNSYSNKRYYSYYKRNRYQNPYSYYKKNPWNQGYSYGRAVRNGYQQSSAGKMYASRRTFAYPSQGPVHARGTFIFDPKQLSWAAYNAEGRLIKTGAASGGSNFCGDIGRRCHTPVGSFTVYSKGTALCKSSKYPIERPGAPMPFCMYFHGGYAIHGSYEVRPYNASHGCIRIYPQDARWLSQNAIHPGTRVIVRPYA